MPDMELLLEAERRGILPEDKKPLLDEARKRGLIKDQATITQPEQPKPVPSLGEAAVSGAKQIIPGMGRVLKQTAEAIISPVETTKNIVSTIGGLDPMNQDPKASAMAHAAIKDFTGKYTDYNTFKETLAKNPEKFIMDLTALFSGGASIPGKVGEAMSAAAKVTDPLSLAKTIATAPAKIAGSMGAAEKVYGSLTKMSTTIPAEQRAILLSKGVENEIVPSQAGIQKFQKRINDVVSEMDQTVLQDSKSGRTISTQPMVDKLEELKTYVKDTYPDPTEAVASIEKMQKNFVAVHGSEISMQKALAMKKELNSQLQPVFGQEKKIMQEQLMSVRSGIQDQLLQMYPELKILGKDAKESIDLVKQIDRASNRLENKNIIGLDPQLATLAMHAATGRADLALWTGIGRAIANHPYVGSQISFALNRARKAAYLKQAGMVGRSGEQISTRTPEEPSMQLDDYLKGQ